MVIKIKEFDVTIDDEDYELVGHIKWGVNMGKNEKAGKHYFVKGITLKPKKYDVIYLHRIILKAEKGDIVDHINGNTLDNRKSNLRICTQLENCRNVKKNKRNTSGYKGVSFSSNMGKYRAAIKATKGKKIVLGYFDDPSEAHKAYCEASKKYHGCFGRTE